MSQNTTVETPAWVLERTQSILSMLEHQYRIADIRVEQMTEPHRTEHGWWICTADYEEGGTRLGYNRLTVQHPANCACELFSDCACELR